MTNRLFRIITLTAGLIFISLSVLILAVDMCNFKNQLFIYPEGTSINTLPIGGLSREEAEARLTQIFSLPIELRYDQARIQFSADDLGFQSDILATLDQIELSLQQRSYWQHLWSKPRSKAGDFPISANMDETVAINLLTTQIRSRYDQPVTAALPVVGTTHFESGTPGTMMQIDQALPFIQSALASPVQRVVTLPLQIQEPATLNIANLEIFLKQEIAAQKFPGVVEIFIHDLSGERNVQFAVNNYEGISPDVAFSAASTIKIPIMVSVLARTDMPTPGAVQSLLERMIIYSENPPADKLMSTYIDEIRGPLIVTQDMRDLGFENTFLAGYFFFGAPVLQLFTTPANTRTDISLDPDVYNQSVTSELGGLLSEVYTCANDLTPTEKLAANFSGKMTQEKCQNIIDLLSRNKIGLLIEGGMPPEATVAHKHGWTSELDGLLHTMSDAAIVYSPGGNFVLTMFIYSPQQLLFNDGNWLFARLSQTIYNAFNLENQTYWWIE